MQAANLYKFLKRPQQQKLLWSGRKLLKHNSKSKLATHGAEVVALVVTVVD
jgi:hypothetical protein